MYIHRRGEGGGSYDRENREMPFYLPFIWICIRPAVAAAVAFRVLGKFCRVCPLQVEDLSLLNSRAGTGGWNGWKISDWIEMELMLNIAQADWLLDITCRSPNFWIIHATLLFEFCVVSLCFVWRNKPELLFSWLSSFSFFSLVSPSFSCIFYSFPQSQKLRHFDNHQPQSSSPSRAENTTSSSSSSCAGWHFLGDRIDKKNWSTCIIIHPTNTCSNMADENNRHFLLPLRLDQYHF